MTFEIRRFARIAFAAMALSVAACAGTYSAKPITATVVDAETGEPLEGVVVVAHWVMVTPYPSIGNAGDLVLLEAVTDKEGKFYFPGWANKALPSDLPRGSKLGNADPGIIVFKGGYDYRGLGNSMQLDRIIINHTWERYSDWDGKIIKLEKYKGENYPFTGLTTGIGSGIDCHWKRVPRFYAALLKEKERLDKLEVRNFLPSLPDMERYFQNSNCGSAGDFFAEYLQ